MSPTGSAPHSGEVPTLADLIKARRAERGWSYRQLAARADDVVSAQRWQQLGTDVRIKEFPEPATIQAISEALEVELSTVVLAAAGSIGLPVHRRQSDLAMMLPHDAALLTDHQRDAVLEVVRSMIAPDDAGEVVARLAGLPPTTLREVASSLQLMVNGRDDAAIFELPTSAPRDVDPDPDQTDDARSRKPGRR